MTRGTVVEVAVEYCVVVISCVIVDASFVVITVDAGCVVVMVGPRSVLTIVDAGCVEVWTRVRVCWGNVDTVVV